MQPFDLVLFGGSGDLAMRKLLPALFRRHLAGQIPAGLGVLGMARGKLEREAYRQQVAASCRQHSEGAFNARQRRSIAERLHYLSADTEQPDSFGALAALLAGREAVTRVLFRSTAPALFAGICDRIGRDGLRWYGEL